MRGVALIPVAPGIIPREAALLVQAGAVRQLVLAGLLAVEGLATPVTVELVATGSSIQRPCSRGYPRPGAD